MSKRNIILALFIVGFGFLLYFFGTYDQENTELSLKDQLKEYPMIYQTNKNFAGIVSNCFVSKITGKGFLIELTNGDKFTVFGANGNSNYTKERLNDNLELGDSIYYNHKTSEFFIYKEDGEELRFKLFD